MKFKGKNKKIESTDVISKNDFDLEEIHLDDVCDHSVQLIKHKTDNKITALEFVQEKKKKQLTHCCFSSCLLL